MSTDKIERWKSLLEAEPGNPLHTFALAQAYLAARDFAAAERTYARCLELDPGWMVAAIRRGRCLVALERWEDARVALDLGARLADEQDHEEPFGEIRELRDQIPED